MGLFDRLFGTGGQQPPPPNDDVLVPVPIPPLVSMLIRARNDHGRELSEAEVLEVRDNCGCIMMSKSHADQMAEKRGYDDVRPELVWEDWKVVVAELGPPDGDAPKG
jgi:hypothetical protein